MAPYRENLIPHRCIVAKTISFRNLHMHSNILFRQIVPESNQESKMDLCFRAK